MIQFLFLDELLDPFKTCWALECYNRTNLLIGLQSALTTHRQDEWLPVYLHRQVYIRRIYSCIFD